MQVIQIYREVVLAFDEMKIQESLVFNENTGQMLGFVDIGISMLSYNHLRQNSLTRKSIRLQLLHM